jgi:hypothetical protein
MKYAWSNGFSATVFDLSNPMGPMPPKFEFPFVSTIHILTTISKKRRGPWRVR